MLVVWHLYFLRLTDEHGPDIDKNEQRNVCQLLQREDKWEDMIWHTLRPAVNCMESMARIRTWHNPFVVSLVQLFVDKRVVQSAVDPVDEEICEEEEKRELQIVVQRKWRLSGCIVKLCVPLNLGQHEWNGENSETW